MTRLAWSYLLLAACALALLVSVLQLTWWHTEDWTWSLIWLLVFALLAAVEVKDIRELHRARTTTSTPKHGGNS